MRGVLPRDEGRELERHLAGCVSCQAAVAAAGDAQADTVRWRGHRFGAAVPADPAGDPALAAAEGSDPAAAASARRLRGVLRGLGVASDAFGASLLEELLAVTEHRRRALVARDPRFASMPLAERLARSCRAAWLDAPAAAVELARLAVAVASRLDADLYGAAPVAAARTLAWSQLGNSYRVAAASRAVPRDAIAENGERDDLPAVAGGEPGDGDLYPPMRVAGSTIGEPAGGGPFSAAVAALEETRDAALLRGMAFEAALVTVDLAAAHLRRGAPDAARELLATSPARLAGAGLGDDGVASIRALAAAAGDGGLDLARLEAAAAELSRARSDPAARFGDGAGR